MQFSRYLTYSKSDSSYRFASWAIKLVLVIASLYYVITKLIEEGVTFISDFNRLASSLFLGLSVLVILLMVVNWLLESKKWQLVVHPYVHISLVQALKAIVAGVSMDAVLPMGAGAITGKVLSVKSKDRNNLYLPVILAQGLQSFWTVVLGMFGMYQLATMTRLSTLYSFETKGLIIGSLLLFTVAVLVFRSKIRTKVVELLEVYSIATWVILTGLSLLRYLIFLGQLILLTHFISPNIPLSILIGCSTWMFFAKTIVPKPGHIGALGIRGASSVFFLNLAGYPFSGFVLATFILWVINLAIPSLFGIFFIKDLHLTTDVK